MSLKVQGSPSLPAAVQHDTSDLGVNTLQSATETMDVSQQNQFKTTGAEASVQTEASSNFAQSSNAQVSSGMNLLNLQIAEGQQPLELTAQASVSSAQQVDQVAAPKVQAAQVQVAQEVTDPATLEKQQNAETVTKFYTAMQSGDYDTIMSLYHPDAKFTDPAFPGIKGKKLGGMWKLITGAKPEIQFRDVKANDDGTVTGHWDADYELIKGNPIHNQIDSTFEFKDGKIINHTDNFDFSKWADQALPGFIGKLAGTRVGHFVMSKILLPFAI